MVFLANSFDSINMYTSTSFQSQILKGRTQKLWRLLSKPDQKYFFLNGPTKLLDQNRKRGVDVFEQTSSKIEPGLLRE